MYGLPHVNAPRKAEYRLADSRERPRAGDPPRLDGDLETLAELLEIERARLRTARCIEEKREIVFPETSVIVRDIMKIMAAINGLKGKEGNEAIFDLDFSEEFAALQE